MSNAWNQLEQLLTCCICLDRYRQPKLLPCQHSFCEPCLDGLVDYVRKQIKCPECRAEHRLPYTGDPNFPVNFTLMRFLELYQRLTGEEVEPLPSMLERCTVCSEKAEVTLCAHCDKKVCEECKNAHIQIMQRELQRLNSQIRRALSRFNEELGQLKKCDDKLRFGCEQARSSIVDLAASLVCLIKEKEKQLLKELEDFEQSEESNLKKLREGLDEEYNNQVANCELIEKNVLNYSSSRQANQSNLNLSVLEDDDSSNELIQWSDLELVEFRELFLKMLEFLRNFETLDGMEYARSALKLDVIKDLDNVRKQAANYASLKIQYMATEKLQLQQQMVAQLAAGMPIQAAGSPNYAQPLGSTHALNQVGTGQLNVPLQQSILMRSQSDHRLATQFAKKELLQKQQGGSPSGKYGTANYGEHDLNNQYGSATTGHYAPGQASTQYRSRFMREKNAELNAMHDSDESYDPYAAHRVRFGAEEGMQQLNPVQLAAQLQSALKVFDTKDASRCPLSSIVKLNESSHFMERIDENKRKAKKLEKEKAETKAMSQPPIQHSSVGQSNPIQQPINPSIQHANLTSRQSPIQQHGSMTGNTVVQQQQQQQLGQNKAPPPNRQMSEDEIDKQKRLNKQWELQSLNNSGNLADVNNTTVNSAPVQQLVSQQSQQSAPRQPLQKQNSIHGPEPSMPTSQLAGQNKLVSKSLLSGGVGSVQQSPHSRLNQTSSGPDEEDEEIEDSVEEDSDEDDDDSALPGNARSLRNQTMAKNHISLGEENKKKEITKRAATKTMQTNPLATSTATTSSANRTTASRLAGRPVKTEASKLTLDQSNSANNARRIRPNKDSKLMSEEKKATGPRSSAATAAAASPAIDSSSAASSSTQSSSTLARKDTNGEEIKYKYRTRVPKKTLNGLLDEEKGASLDMEQLSRNLDDPQSTSTSISQLQKQHSLESNLRPNKKDAEHKNRQLRKSRTSGLYMAEGGAFDYLSSSDEEPPIAPIPNKLFDSTDQLLYKQKLEQRTELYRNKGAVKLCIGRQGAGTGEFSYPRDVVYAKFTLKTKLIGQQVLMVVDSGNSRIQIFDTQGKYLSEFGQNGTGQGAFDCPSSACCFPEGTIVVSDTNNHRLQFFDSNGRFIRQIGGRPPGAQTPGTGQPPPVFATTFESSGMNLARQTSAEPGQFAFPYGVCYDTSQNELYVCDKENGVIQILDGEGNFKRFLSQHRSGRLNAIFRLTFKSPNFVHSNGQQLICSDTNSHCVHVFSLKNSQKRILGEGEGIQEGKFKKPRGVALDEMNFAIVADAGNNRVQIFRPDGSFLKSFGSWGSSNGQFKGIEGIAVDDFGDIYVCDRESGKIQVF